MLIPRIGIPHVRDADVVISNNLKIRKFENSQSEHQHIFPFSHFQISSFLHSLITDFRPIFAAQCFHVGLDNFKKIYFASDVHLGFGAVNHSHEREKLFVKWLREVQGDASMIFLLGDIFDFWFEYRKVSPQGFVRVLGTLADICDNGIPVHFFTGNHDIWIFDYLPRETGMIIHTEPYETELAGKKFFIAHGDDLGKKDTKYQLLQRFFHNRVAQWLFSKIHPDISFAWAHRWSRNNRLAKGIDGVGFLGEDKEDQIIFAKDFLTKKHIDYFVFGHRHIALEYQLIAGSKLFMLGNWFNDIAYGVFDGKDFYLKRPDNLK